MELLFFFVLTSAVFVAGQRPFYAGSKPIGFYVPPTTTEILGDRFGVDGVATTLRPLPLEANGDRDLIDRLSKLPIDNQPFWFINWQALEDHRNNPQTYPQRPNTFITPISPNPIENSNSLLPNSNSVLPNLNTVLPNSNSVLPNSNTVLPNSNSKLPNSNSVLPNSNTVLPNSNSELGNSNSATPSSTSIVADYVMNTNVSSEISNNNNTFVTNNPNNYSVITSTETSQKSTKFENNNSEFVVTSSVSSSDSEFITEDPINFSNSNVTLSSFYPTASTKITKSDSNTQTTSTV